MVNRHKVAVASYVILRRANQILMMRRVNTGYRDGDYGLPSGHVEKDELPDIAAIRETHEEIGVKVNDLRFVHVLYTHTNEYYICFFFESTDWKGEIKNCEKDKCDDIRWFDLDALPDNITPEVNLALENYSKKVYYSKLTISK